MIKKYLGFTVIVTAALLAGCVTSSTVKTKPVDKQSAVETRVQLAVGYLQEGNHERARTHLHRALEIDGRSAGAHDVMALLLQQEMEYEESEKHYKLALKYSPDFTRGRNNYGLLLFRLGRYEEACNQFSRGSKDLEYPRRAELFLKVGLCRLKLDQVEDARNAFVRSVALNPRLSTSYLELAELEFEAENYVNAKQLVNKYNQHKRRPSARGLWLGVRLERIFNDRDAEASQGLALKKMFPDSQENLDYQNWLKHEQQR